MSTQTPEYTAGQLRRMDEDTARTTLTVAQYEKREQVLELHDQAAETRERWADESETVADVTVHADIEQLGTRVDLFGNDVLVHIADDDRQFRQAAEALHDEFGDEDRENPEDLPEQQRELMVDHLTTMYDRILRRWNGTQWRSLDDDTRQSILTDARDKWGLDGYLLGWFEIGQAVHAEREDTAEAVESFLGETGRGDH